MKNLSEILLQKKEIISLAKRFGFDCEVRILCEEASVTNNVTVLNFLVRKDPEKEVTSANFTYLSVKLTELLGCYVLISPEEAVESLYKEKVIERSLPLTASKEEFSKLFNVENVEKIFLKKPSKHVREILLEKANEYLQQRPVQEEMKTLPLPTAEVVNKQSLLTQAAERVQKRSRQGIDDSRPNEDSTLSTSTSSKTPSPK